jgi:hypothetical protein
LRKAELVEGEAYVLEMPGARGVRRATLLSKAGEQRGRVKVRLHDAGVDTGDLEVPSRWVKAYSRDQRVAALELVETTSFAGPVAWIPKGGDVVERSDAPGFWIARQVDLNEGRARVEGVLVGLRRLEDIPVSYLLKPVPPPRPSPTEIEDFLRRHGLALDLPKRPRLQAVEEWSCSVEPLPEPEEIVDRFDFGATARAQYLWISNGCPRGKAGTGLRWEIGSRGVVQWLDEGDAGYLRDEYVRYAVPGRFAVVLFEDPSGDDRKISVARIFQIG